MPQYKVIKEKRDAEEAEARKRKKEAKKAAQQAKEDAPAADGPGPTSASERTSIEAPSEPANRSTTPLDPPIDDTLAGPDALVDVEATRGRLPLLGTPGEGQCAEHQR